MKAGVLEKKFDSGVENVTGDVSGSRAARPAGEPRLVSVELPQWVVESLDREASRLGVTRQLVLKMWVADRRRHVG